MLIRKYQFMPVLGGLYILLIVGSSVYAWSDGGYSNSSRNPQYDTYEIILESASYNHLNYFNSSFTQTSPTGNAVSRYAGSDGVIQRDEAVQAVIDYFNGIITRQEAIEVVLAFFNAPQLSAFTLAFPLPDKNAYNATILAVFDHSMNITYCPDYKVVAYTGETGTVRTQQVIIASKDCNGDGINENLYGYYKYDRSPFRVNGHYDYSDNLRYDGHTGTDYPVPAGTDVLAVADGIVVQSRWSSAGGNYIIIDHRNSYRTYYGHLSSMMVNESQAVTKGEVIGKSGNTQTTTPHLHFEVSKNYVPVDPYGWEGQGADPYTAGVNIRLWS